MDNLEEMTNQSPRRSLMAKIVDSLVKRPSLYVAGVALFALCSYGCTESGQDQPEPEPSAYSEKIDAQSLVPEQADTAGLSIEEKRTQCLSLYKHCAKEAYRLLTDDPEKIGYWEPAMEAIKATCMPVFIDQCLARLDTDEETVATLKDLATDFLAGHEKMLQYEDQAKLAQQACPQK